MLWKERMRSPAAQLLWCAILVFPHLAALAAPQPAAAPQKHWDPGVLYKVRYPRLNYFRLSNDIVDVLPDVRHNRFWVLRKAAARVDAHVLTTGELVASIGTGLEPESMAITYNKRYLGVGSRSNIYLTVIDLDSDLSGRLGFYNSGDLQKVFRVTAIGTSDLAFITRPDSFGSPPFGGRLNIWHGDSHTVELTSDEHGAENILCGLPPTDDFLVAK